MAVDSVNGNNNTALYTGIGAVAGAGAGVAAGYLTKPFLKDGAPTDEFVKKIGHNLKTSDLLKAVWVIHNKNETEVMDLFGRAKNPEELKGLFVNKLMEYIKEAIKLENGSTKVNGGGFKEAIDATLGFLKEIGIGLDGNDIEKMQQLENIDGVNGVLKEYFDKVLQGKGKTVEEIKISMLATADEADKKAPKALFKSVWDTKEKKFVNCEDGVGKAIKYAARSIQGKYALIYGSIGAAVLGLGTYLFAHGKSSKADAVESQSAK